MPNSAYYCNSKQVLDKKSKHLNIIGTFHIKVLRYHHFSVVTTGAPEGYLLVLQGLKVKV